MRWFALLYALVQVAAGGSDLRDACSRSRVSWASPLRFLQGFDGDHTLVIITGASVAGKWGGVVQYA